MSGQATNDERHEAALADRLEAAYRRERDAAILARLPLTIALFLAGVGAATLAEWVLFPARRPLALLVYAGYVLTSAVGFGVATRRRRALPPPVAAGALGCAWSVLLALYTGIVGQPERGASGQLCLFYGLFFLLPWSWPPQLAVALVALAGVTATAVAHGLDEPTIYAFIVTITGAVTSVGGVVFLERFRREAFLRHAAAERASREKAEEAEIAAALLRLSETLTARAKDPDLLEGLTRAAVETVGCDWGTTFVRDASTGAYRLASEWGASPVVREEVRAVEFGPADLPLIAEIAPGRLIEIADRDAQALVPPALLARWEVASELIAPIALGAEVIGVVCLAYRRRRGPFSKRERRLANGIVHATAVALETSRLIADLRAASRVRSEFVSTMSHELRTPLNVILGFVEMAQDPALPPAERDDLLRRVEAAGRDLLQLIEDTLALGRMEAGRDDVRLERLPLADIWAALGHECASLPRRPDVRLAWVPPPAGVQVLIDRRKLTLIVRNLVHNALKFTETGEVRAAAGVEGTALTITVRDTGIGIDPAAQDAIFEMFRQGDGSDTRRFGGTGLGLHIVRRSVEQLGGAIRVESAPGLGSTFTVRFPTAAAAEQAA